MILSTLLSAIYLATPASPIVARQSDLTSCLTGPDINLVTPSDKNYHSDSLAFNRRFQYQPAALVYPNSPAAVAAAVKCASGFGLPVVARSGGHSYAAYSLGGQNGSMVIDLSKLKSVSLDNSTGHAVSQTGNRLGELATAIYNQGKRALPHGTCPMVGSGGHTAFGGFGVFSRAQGLLLDHVVSADVILANGTAITASESSNSDIFWAIRGAAPSFGIVTAWTFSTVPAPPNTILWSIKFSKTLRNDQVVATLQAFEQFAYSNPDNNLSLIIYLAPKSSGGLEVHLSGTYYGTEGEFKSVIIHLQSSLPRGNSLKDSSNDWLTGLTKFAGGPLTTSQGDGHDTFFAKSIMSKTPYSQDTWKAWVNYMMTEEASVDYWVQIDVYGGAIAQIPDQATSYAHRDAVFNVQFYSWVKDGDKYPDSGIDFINGLAKTLDANPYASYPNYVDPTLDSTQWSTLYFGDHYQRLTTIKREVDPENLFRFPQSVTLAGDGVTGMISDPGSEPNTASNSSAASGSATAKIMGKSASSATRLDLDFISLSFISLLFALMWG